MMYVYSTCQEEPSWSHGSWISIYICKQSVTMTTKVVSSNPVHGDVYSIQQSV